MGQDQQSDLGLHCLFKRLPKYFTRRQNRRHLLKLALSGLSLVSSRGITGATFCGSIDGKKDTAQLKMKHFIGES